MSNFRPAALSQCPSRIWFVVMMASPVGIITMLFVSVVANLSRRFRLHQWPHFLRRRVRDARGGHHYPGLLSSLQKHRKTAVKPAPVGSSCNASRDIEVIVSTECGRQVALTVDILSPGEVLRQRAGLALGVQPSRLQMPSGEDLLWNRPLNAQGVKSGQKFSAFFPERAAVPGPEHAPLAVERRSLEMKRFSFTTHTSEVSVQQDSFEITISSRQEPEALQEAEHENLCVEFSEKAFTVSIRGHVTDYILRRRIGAQGAIEGNILPVGFTELCPPRCSFTLTPTKKITVVLRPFPDDWLRAGTRVKLVDLRETCHLNGSLGVITEFFEGGGKFLPTRYGVRLDNGAVKKIQRKNIEVLESKSGGPQQSTYIGGSPNGSSYDKCGQAQADIKCRMRNKLQHAADHAAGAVSCLEFTPPDDSCIPDWWLKEHHVDK